MESPRLTKEERYRDQTPTQNTNWKLQLNHCCQLANTNEELHKLATAIPPFAKLLRSLLRPIRRSMIVPSTVAVRQSLKLRCRLTSKVASYS